MTADYAVALHPVSLCYSVISYQKWFRSLSHLFEDLPRSKAMAEISRTSYNIPARVHFRNELLVDDRLRMESSGREHLRGLVRLEVQRYLQLRAEHLGGS